MIDLAVLSTFPPRRCGIATYTRDLCAAISDDRRVRLRVIAIDDIESGTQYAPVVQWRLNPTDPADYCRLAGEIGDSSADIILIQHEYGLFGGDHAGEMLLSFVDQVRQPIMTSLHTVLSTPDPAVADVTRALCARSSVVVVPGPASAGVLVRRYGVDADTIVEIPHGVPRSQTMPGRYGESARRSVVMTFGFLGPSKGIELGLAVVAELRHAHPDLLYRIVGSQHPNERRQTGESYRRRLSQLVTDLDLARHVQFIDRYVGDGELGTLLQESSVCLLPYTEPEQAVSGTLARALGAGRAVVATAFRHALEVGGHGAADVVPIGDAAAMAEAVSALLTDPIHRRAIERRARQVAHTMRWDRVANRYVGQLRRVTMRHGA